MKKTILVVDDEQANLDTLVRLFRKDYNVFTANAGEQALEILKNEDICLIISDQRMPRMSGVEFFAESMKIKPGTIRILLTGYADVDSLMSAINTGQIYRYVTKPWDSTDLKNAVAKAIEKFDLRAELENKNAALAKAVEKLRELDEAKTRFMMLVNHELKTPLTGISSFLALLNESQLDDEQKLFVSRIQKNTDRLHKMIEEVMQLISAQTGLVKMQPQEFSSHGLIDELIKSVDADAAKRKINLVVDNRVDNIVADQEILKKVLWRLTENAVKFADQSSQVSVQTSARDEGIEFKIENNGSLDQNKIAKILEPFVLDENVMNHSGGLGLGLSISEALLKNHNSHLNIAANDGKVSVSFCLPYAKKNLPSPE